jgi:hypothetical protein
MILKPSREVKEEAMIASYISRVRQENEIWLQPTQCG